MPKSLVLPAPAKLNLFLHITGRRDDGYHLLQTVFQFVDLSDQISCHHRDDEKIIRVHDLPGVPESEDLVIRAARHLQQSCHVKQGMEIEVEKKLPMGGGLGGGSSDAATVLHACNQLWKCGLSNDELAEIGVSLGADVPVFIQGFAAWAEGIGEVLKPIDLEEPWYLILSPQESISTAEIFLREGLTRDCDPITIADFLEGQGVNVFESEARKMSEDVDNALDWLSQFAPARLTGSGSCLFAAFNNKNEAEQVLNQVPQPWHGYVTKGINKSPLLSVLSNH